MTLETVTMGGRMRIARVLTLVALGTMAQGARAAPPVSGATLGQLEAVLEHCGRVAPAHPDRLKELARSLTGDVAEEDLTEVRAGPEYREAYGKAKEQLAQVPQEASEQACQAGLAMAAR